MFRCSSANTTAVQQYTATPSGTAVATVNSNIEVYIDTLFLR